MTKNSSFQLVASFLILIAGSQTTIAQSTTRDSEFQEDFYQPVQDLWNQPPVETPDITSSYPTGDDGAFPITQPAPQGPIEGQVQGPSFPAYTQQGEYPEIPLPSYGGGISAAPYDPAPTVGPRYQVLPETVGTPQVVNQSPPAGATAGSMATCPPSPTFVTGTVPTTSSPLSDVGTSAYPATRSMFFRVDALLGGVNENDDGAIGSPDAEGVYITNGILFPYTNSLSTGIFDNDAEWGNRYEFGALDAQGGWMISILDWDQHLPVSAAGGAIQFNDPFGMLLGYADGNGDSIDDDVNGDHVYGRNGIDLGTPDPFNLGTFLPVYDGIIDGPAPADTGDLLTWVPTFNDLQATSRIDFVGFEIMKAWSRQHTGRFGFVHHWLGGIRYLDIEERFSLTASGGVFDPTTIDAAVENFVIGPQFGTEFCRRVGVFRVGGTLRLLLGINFQRGQQAGSYAVNGSPGGQNQPVNLSPGSFSHVEEDATFAPLFEWRFDAAYDIGQHFAVRVGYTGMVVGGIGRAANSIEYTLPSFGMSLNNDDAIVFNAFTAGLEVYF